MLKTLELNIAGIPSQINIHQTAGDATLARELALYPLSREKPVVVFHFVSHGFFYRSKADWNKNTLIIEKKNSSVAIITSELSLQVYFCIIPHKNRLFRTLQRLASNQFTIREEYIGQVFHENVLLPAYTKLKEVLLIHGAAFAVEGKTVLVGGQGGVGKTSIELKMCYHQKGAFIADDMAVIHNGMIAPNLSFPKIYSYNLKGEIQIRNKIFESFSIWQRIHWHLFPLIFKKNPRVRINPYDYYNVGKENKLDYYLIIERVAEESVFEQQILEVEKAEAISSLIINDELKQFCLDENFFNAHKINFMHQLEKTKCLLVKVSKNMNHQEYLTKMQLLIEQQIK